MQSFGFTIDSIYVRNILICELVLDVIECSSILANRIWHWNVQY